MESVTATFEIVTPMFLGDAGGHATVLRPASIKAELVFWWRALHAARAISEADDIHTGLKALHAREVELFGGPGGGTAPRQSSVHINARWVSDKVILAAGGILTNDGSVRRDTNVPNQNRAPDVCPEGVRYLGYGVIQPVSKREDPNQGWHHDNVETYAGELLRSAFQQDTRFAVEILFKPSVSDRKSEILNALKIMGLLGGLGSRKRRGWGSFRLISLQPGPSSPRSITQSATSDWSAPATKEEWRNRVADLVALNSRVKASQMPLAAFASGSEVRIWKSGVSRWIEAMERLGHGLRLYRGWGFKGGGDTEHKIGGEPAKQNFKPEHDWFRNDNLDARKRGRHGLASEEMPPRANLGLPQNYGPGQKHSVDADSPFGRRASPLIFRIAKIGEAYFPVAIHMGNMFLPETGSGQSKSVKLKIGGTGGHVFQPDPGVVKDYFDGSVKQVPAQATYFDGDPAGNVLTGGQR